jgi:molecular chaperone GrpE
METGPQETAINNGINEERDEYTQTLVECQEEVHRWKENFLRVNADLENIKRRSFKEQEQMIARISIQIFGDLLLVIDNFDRALNAASTGDNHDPLYTGLLLIRKELNAMLERYGVRPITQMEHFDPELHEAVTQTEDAQKQSGVIIAVLQKGYFYKDQVLRHAKVTVAR